tara:strand:- start:9650 stop:10573 length:924 start_codon:yes stop_codon:yes gene_type:complete
VSLLGLLQALAVVTIVLSIVTLLDVPHRNIELFSHFRLQYFVAAALLTIAFVVLKSAPYAAALGLMTIINGSLVVPWYLPVKDGPSATGELKLIHANVYSRNKKYEKVAALVDRENPDLVFLQEVTEDWATAMQGLLPDYPYSYTQARTGNFGIAVFSKMPFDSITHIDSPPLGYPTIIASVRLGESSTTIISSHPTIPLGRHLNDARNEHIRDIAERVRTTPGNIVLLGDFNESMWGPRYRGLVDTTGLKAARRGFGVVPTWPTFFPIAMIPIDHVFVSPDIGIAEFRSGHRIGSDHLPLIVTLSL